MPKPYVFYIDGMTCTSCSGVLENTIRANSDSDVEYFHVDLTSPDPKKTTVILKNESSNYHYSWNKLKQEIEDVGFECRAGNYEPQLAAVAQVTPKERSFFTIAKKMSISHWFLGSLGCTLGCTLLLTFLITANLPLATMIVLGGLSTLLTLVLGAHSYYEAWKKLSKAKTLTMDSLFAISTLTVLTVSIAAFFIPWLPMMFEAGLLIYGFRHIGLAIEETLKEKIRPAQFQDRTPQAVHLILPSGVYKMPVTAITPDMIIAIKPGELIPLDGLCLEEGSIYNTIVSGSTVPRHYRVGERVLAGMRLAEQSTAIKIRVLHKVNDSYLARLDSSIAQTIHQKIPLEIKTQKVLSYFIPAVIAFAVLSGLAIGLFFPAAVAIQCAVSVLVSACPCTLGLIIPLAVKTGMYKGAEYGVHFKNSTAIQEAEQIDTVLFDLNGTLTTGIPQIRTYGLTADTSCSIEQLFSICAALETQAKHPIGETIYAFTKMHNKEHLTAAQLNSKHHAGIVGMIAGQEYAIGGSGLMQSKGIATQHIAQKLRMQAGDSMVYVAQGQRLLGYFIISDPLRPDALKTINTLKKMGKEIHLCTGADEETARRYASALGIKHIYANSVATTLNPNDKAKPAYINGLQKKHKKVAMIGDAANDTHALAASNLGIAMLSPNADELTQQCADAVIQNGTLMSVANAFAVSQQTVSNIKQNLLMSLGYNVGSLVISGGLLVSLGFTINPALGAALMAIQACIILMNVYYFKQKPFAHLTEQLAPDEGDASFSLMQKKANLLRNNNHLDAQSVLDERPLCNSPLFKPCLTKKPQEEFKTNTALAKITQELSASCTSTQSGLIISNLSPN